MSEPTLDTLTQRLDRLERGNRWWRRGAVLVVLSLAGALVIWAGSLKGQRLEVERLIIRDARGAVRATLGPEGDKGGVLLKFFGKDSQAKEQASAIFGVLTDTVVSSSAVLILSSKPDPTQATGNISALAANSDSIFTIRYGKTQGGLMAAADGTLLTTADKEGRAVLTVGSTPDGPFLALADGQRPRVGMTLDADGTPSIKVLTKDGKVIWKAP